ncbi:hypothetical protein D3C73_804330 [compost metagenome]
MEHHIANVRDFGLHLAVIEHEGLQWIVIHFPFPFIGQRVCFFREGIVVPVQWRVKAPVGKSGVIRVLFRVRVLVVSDRIVMNSRDAVHDQIVQLLVVLQQIDHHQCPLGILGGGVNSNPVLRRDSHRLLLVRCNVSQCQLIWRILFPHVGYQCAKRAQIVRNRRRLASPELLLVVQLAVQRALRPGIVIGKVFIIVDQFLKFRRLVHIEYFTGGIGQLEAYRQIKVEHIPFVLLLQQDTVEIVELPVSGLRCERNDTLFLLGDGFKIGCVGFRTVNLRQAVFRAKVLPVKNQLLDRFPAVLGHHIELAVHLRLPPAYFRHRFPGHRSVLLQHVFGQLQETAFDGLIVIACPVGGIDEVKILVGREFKRIFLRPIRPVEKFAFQGRIDLLLQLLVDFSKHCIVVNRLWPHKNHLQRNGLGCIHCTGISGCLLTVSRRLSCGCRSLRL